MPQTQRQMVLLSDGEESCNGNLPALLTRLGQQSSSDLLTIYSIGVGIGGQTFDQLRSISEATGGRSFEITKPSDLGVVEAEVNEAIALVLEDRPIDLNSVANRKDTSHPGSIDKGEEISRKRAEDQGARSLGAPKESVRPNRSPGYANTILLVCILMLCSYIAYAVTAGFERTNEASERADKNGEQKGKSSPAAPDSPALKNLEDQIMTLHTKLRAAQERVQMQKQVIDVLVTEFDKQSTEGGRR